MFAAACLGLLLLLGGALGVVAAMYVDHRGAQSAADLTALAAAQAVGEGTDPCVVARRISAANGATLADCMLEGEEVTVTVVVEGPRWLGQRGDLHGRARAGPA